MLTVTLDTISNIAECYKHKEYTQLLNILVDTWFSFDSDAQLLTVIMDTTSYRFMVDFSVTFVDNHQPKRNIIYKCQLSL